MARHSRIKVGKNLIVDSKLLACLHNDGGYFRVIRLVDGREQVVDDLVVQGAGQESGERITVSIVLSSPNLHLSPVV